MGLFDFFKKKSSAVPDDKETADAERKRQEQLQEAEFVAALDAIPAVEIAVAAKPAKKRSVAEADDLPFANITKKTPRDKLGDFVVFDTETTGLNPSQAEIVEISAIRFRQFKPVAKFTTLCKPRRGITPEAAKVNGITEEMVADAPEFGCVVESLVSFFGKDNLVGHNLGFDLRFIVKYGADIAETPRKYYDTLDLAERTLKKVKNKWDKELECYEPDVESDFDVWDYKLGTLCKYYGVPYFGAHRALADCYVTGKLLEKLARDRE